jgi:general secretion pathway protein F
VLLLLSGFLSSHLGLVTLAFGVLLALLAWCWRTGLIAAAAAGVLSRIAPLQRQWDHFRLAKLYQSLALMFKGGYTLDEAMSVCERLGLGSRMATGLEVARKEITRGRGVAEAMAAGGFTDAVSERLIAVGERSGSFEIVLQTIADRHSQAFLTFIERATRIVEPILLLLVALVVGGIVVMMYLPIFDIASSMR